MTPILLTVFQWSLLMSGQTVGGPAVAAGQPATRVVERRGQEATARPGDRASTRPRARPASRPTTGPTTRVAATRPALPPEIKAAATELWRRGSCQLSSVYEPAAKESAVPKDLGDVPIVTPRTYLRNPVLFCYATDGKSIYTGDDMAWYWAASEADRAGSPSGPQSAQPAPDCLSAGSPAEPVQAMVCDGHSAWAATRSGLVRFLGDKRAVAPVPDVRFNVAALAVGGGSVWAFSDTGVYRTPSGRSEWRKLPDPPGLDKLAAVSARGFWNVVWNDRVAQLIPSIFATEDGLYVVCMNQFLRFDPKAEKWSTICEQAWQAAPQGRIAWATTTAGVVRYDPATGRTQTFEAGKGPAAGRPVALAADNDAFWLLSLPDYDAKESKFVGGGISRYDAATGQWTVTDTVDGTDVRLATAVLLDGGDAWVACRLYDRVIESGAHPGMAHVKRWTPHVNGLGLLRWNGGKWQLLKRENLKTETRWVLGQSGTAAKDTIGPDTVIQLCRHGSEIWGVYRMVPEHYYSGYYMSVGCLATCEPVSSEPAGPRNPSEPAGPPARSEPAGPPARQTEENWRPVFDTHTDELGLAGEQPDVLLLSASHGPEFVLGEGQPAVLGLESIGGNLWAVCQSGLFVKKPGQAKFTPVLEERFRFYWSATVAAPCCQGVIIGGDCGTVSTFDADKNRFVCDSLLAGRKVSSVAVKEAGRVEVRGVKGDVCLPTGDALGQPARIDQDLYESALPNAAALAVSGSGRTDYACKGNYLMKGDRKVAFLKGVFRPRLLCEDAANGQVWLATYEGVACVPTAPSNAESRPDE